MKRLKLQKALLAIFLALPITLTTSNGINAMQPTDLQTEQKSNNNEPNETTQTADTFSQYYDDYVKQGGKPLSEEDKDYSLFLKKYLREDIIRYLALLIQATYQHIQIWQTKDEIEFIKPSSIYTRLLNHITIDDEWIENPQHLKIPYNTRDEQFTNVKTALNNLFSKPESKLTIEEKILSVLFEDATGIGCPDDIISPLAALIDEYKCEIISVVDQSTATLIRFLEPVAKQLNKELSYLKSQQIEGPQLEQLVSLVSDFSELYKTKQQNTQQLIKSISKTKTHNEALQQYVKLTPIKQLGEEEYKKFLLCYIGNNPGKYLALLLQANYNLISFPPPIYP